MFKAVVITLLVNKGEKRVRLTGVNMGTRTKMGNESQFMKFKFKSYLKSSNDYFTELCISRS